MGSEKLIPRFPLSHISTARALSRAEAGSERSVRELGHFPRPDSSWNSPMKLLLQRAVGAGPRRARSRSASSGGREAVAPQCPLRSVPTAPRGGGSRLSPVYPPEWDAYCRPQPAVPSLPAPSASRHSQSSSRSWHSSPRPSSSLPGAGAGAGDPRLPAALAGGSAGRERRD